MRAERPDRSDRVEAPETREDKQRPGCRTEGQFYHSAAPSVGRPTPALAEVEATFRHPSVAWTARQFFNAASGFHPPRRVLNPVVYVVTCNWRNIERFRQQLVAVPNWPWRSAC